MCKTVASKLLQLCSDRVGANDRKFKYGGVERLEFYLYSESDNAFLKRSLFNWLSTNVNLLTSSDHNLPIIYPVLNPGPIESRACLILEI